MANLVQVPTERGVVLFEVDEVLTGPERVSRRGDSMVVELNERLETALASATPGCSGVVDAFPSALT